MGRMMSEAVLAGVTPVMIKALKHYNIQKRKAGLRHEIRI